MSMLRPLIVQLIVTVLALSLPGCGSNFDTQPGRKASFLLLDSDGIPVAPLWVAFRDGDSPWERIAAAGRGLVWQHPVRDQAGRFAFAVISGDEPSLSIYAGTLGEVTRFTDRVNSTSLPAVAAHLEGSVSGVPSGSYWTVAVGSRSDSLMTETTNNYAIGVRSAGRADLLATLGNGTGASAEITRFWLKRDLVVAGDTQQAIDFDDTLLAAPGSPEQVTVKGGNLISGTASFNTPRTALANGWLRLSSDLGPLSAPELWILSSPSGLLQPEDVQCARGQMGSAVLTNCVAAGSPLELDFTGLTDFQGLSLTGRTLTWQAHPQAQLYDIRVSPTTGPRLTVKISQAAAGSAPAFALPDLSGVSGWDPSWEVELGSEPPLTGSAIWGSISLDALLRQEALNRHDGSYRSWSVESQPAEIGGGSNVFAQCEICRTNCTFQPLDIYNCLNECDLICP
jgi:hypothetical protein